MENEILSFAGITAILVTLFTLVFQYAPGLRVKWAGLKSEAKQVVVLGLYLAVGAFVAFGGCEAFLAQYIAGLQCVDAPTFIQYAVSVVLAVGAGQGVFELLPKKQDVQIAKASR